MLTQPISPLLSPEDEAKEGRVEKAAVSDNLNNVFSSMLVGYPQFPGEFNSCSLGLDNY